MLRKIGLLIGVAACGALVTSCGGDDTPDPTPTPTGTSTATPTPTPTSGVIDFDLTKDFAAQSINSGAIYAYFTPTGGAETFNGAARVNGTSVVSLVSATNTTTFGFPDLTQTVVFDNADLVSSSASLRTYVDGDQQLIMERPFQHVLRVSYEIDNQAFTRNTVAGTLRSRRVALFFNLATTTADITTTLSYTGTPLVAGGAPGSTAPDVISSPAMTFTVTPGTNDTVTGTITIFQNIAGTPARVGQFSVNANLNASGGFSGAIDDTANGLKGEYAGVLVGPNRDEMILLFFMSNANNSEQYVGNFIGDQ